LDGGISGIFRFLGRKDPSMRISRKLERRYSRQSRIIDGWLNGRSVIGISLIRPGDHYIHPWPSRVIPRGVNIARALRSFASRATSQREVVPRPRSLSNGRVCPFACVLRLNGSRLRALVSPFPRHSAFLDRQNFRSF